MKIKIEPEKPNRLGHREQGVYVSKCDDFFEITSRQPMIEMDGNNACIYKRGTDVVPKIDTEEDRETENNEGIKVATSIDVFHL